jgi:hypothetical protein
MSAFEQKREIPNRALQYMVVRPFFQSSSLSLFHSLLLSLTPTIPYYRPSSTIRERNNDTGHMLTSSWRQNHTRRYPSQSLQKIWLTTTKTQKLLGNIGMRMRKFTAVNCCSSREVGSLMYVYYEYFLRCTEGEYKF